MEIPKPSNGWLETTAKTSGYTPYKDYLLTDHWRRLRQKAIYAQGQQCQICSYDYNLQVHHMNYRNLYDCTLDDLLVLCNRCHEKMHDLREHKPDLTGARLIAAIIHEKRKRKIPAEELPPVLKKLDF